MIIDYFHHCLFMHAKSLQLFQSLWPTDWGVPGSSVHGILQRRILQWVARPSPDSGTEPRSPASPALQADSLLQSHWGVSSYPQVFCGLDLKILFFLQFYCFLPKYFSLLFQNPKTLQAHTVKLVFSMSHLLGKQMCVILRISKIICYPILVSVMSFACVYAC